MESEFPVGEAEGTAEDPEIPGTIEETATPDVADAPEESAEPAETEEQTE